MTFSGCGSYRKDTYDYNEYIAIQYVLNSIGFKSLKCWV